MISPTACTNSSVFCHESRSCSAHNGYKGVRVAAEHHDQSQTLCLHHLRSTAELACTKPGKEKKKAQQWDITEWSSSPQSTRMYREESERQKCTEQFVQNKNHQCIRVSLICFPKGQNEGAWQQMTCIWVGCSGMIWGTWVEKRLLFQNGCLHSEVWATGEGCPYYTSLCLALPSPGSW